MYLFELEFSLEDSITVEVQSQRLNLLPDPTTRHSLPGFESEDVRLHYSFAHARCVLGHIVSPLQASVLPPVKMG